MSNTRKKRKNRVKKTTPESSVVLIEQDDYFYFIAGYTDGGAPYGITWEEQEEIEYKERQREQRIETKRDLLLTGPQLHSITECFHRQRDERIEPYLNLGTGDIVRINKLDGDAEDIYWWTVVEDSDYLDHEYIPFLNSEERVWDLYEFAQTIPDAILKKKIIDQLSGGRKRIQRFMKVLSCNRAELNRYVDFKNLLDRERVLEWMRSVGVEVRLS